jgi:ABC-type multidrug transport system fused ATPase/permease subunit
MANPNDTAQIELSRLGAGGSDDRLHFRLVLKLLLRCVSLLKDVKWHLVGIVLAALGLAAAVLPPSFSLFDLFWTRILKGDAPTALQCSLLSAFGTGCDPWTEAARRAALRTQVGVVTGLAVVGGAWFAAIYYYRTWILQRVNQVLRLRLHDRLHALSLRFHNDSTVGDGMYRMYQDSSMVTQLIDMLILMPMLHFGRSAIALGLVALYKPALALALVVGWCIAMVIGYRFSRPLRVGFRRAREHNSALTSLIQASLQGVRVIKAFGAERAEQRRFEALSQAAFKEAYAARGRFVLYSMLMFWAFGVIVVLAIAWGAALTADGADVASQATLMLLAGTGVWTLGLWNNFKSRIGDGTSASFSLFELWGRMQDVAIGLDRVFELLDLEPEVKNASDAVPLAKFERGIEFDDVSFAYAKDKPTLEHVTLAAAPGTITAIVGPTGSGKSTLMSLLLRLYDPDSGEIRIDGVDIRKLQIDSLRANIAIALQENMLFGTTIRENIRYAVAEASDAAVREAARVAAADEFIDKLPEGYDTLLGERGTKLSSGQRQRLSIARALLKDAPILILDEPTAALDAQTELRVLDNLAAWGKGRAVFLITHRLSTIRRADQVVFIQEGRVLEHGSHERLMATAGGAYRRLVEGEEAAARMQPSVAAS